MDYNYRLIQGKLEINLILGCDVQQPLLVCLARFFYYFRNKALLDPPDVYQDGVKVLETQVVAEFEKLKLFMKQENII